MRKPRKGRSTSNSEKGSGLILAVYKRQQSGEEPKPSIVGEYSSAIAGPDNTEQVTDVEIERQGDAYLVTWKRNNATVSTGIGLRTGEILSVSWTTQSQLGIAVYKIDKDRKLSGRFTPFGGFGIPVEETMTPRRRVD
jgi:hypothetical protein